MKKITLMLILLISLTSFSQPTIEWQKCLGGSYGDKGYSIQQTSDGGFIVAGYCSSSTDGDVSGNHGEYDFWVVKLSATATIEWQKCLGGSSYDIAYSIQQTSDGGYIVAGSSYSTNHDVTGNHGGYDYWVVKLSATATIEWQKSLGGSDHDIAYSIQQTSDGGYIVAGASKSTDGDVIGNHGNGYNDYWVVKLSATATIEWQKCLGGNYHDIAYSIQQTSDGGYIVAGASKSTDGDVIGNHGNFDYWVVKLSATATIEWQKCLGGSSDDGANSIQQTSEGGYILAGYSGSSDVTGNHGGSDFWIVKLSATATIEWQKCLGGSAYDEARSIQQTSDGGYIVAGTSNATNGDVTGNHGRDDYWVVKLSATATIEWQKCLGGNSDDEAWSIQQTSDGGYIVIGYCESTEGDVTGNYGEDDFWVVKLFPLAGVNDSELSNTIILYPNPASTVVNLQSAVFNLQSAVAEIYDLNGRKLIERQIPVGGDSFEIDVSSWQSGVYFCRLTINDQIITKKIIKQ